MMVVNFIFICSENGIQPKVVVILINIVFVEISVFDSLQSHSYKQIVMIFKYRFKYEIMTMLLTSTCFLVTPAFFKHMKPKTKIINSGANSCCWSAINCVTAKDTVGGPRGCRRSSKMTYSTRLTLDTV